MSISSGPASDILERNPHFEADLADHGNSWMLLRGGVLNIYGNLDGRDADQIASNKDVRLVQFARNFKVSNRTLVAINDPILKYHPTASIQVVLNGHGAFNDLGFLRHLPNLRALNATGSDPIDIEPVVDHDFLETLGVGGVGTDLRGLANNQRVRCFTVYEKPRYCETVATFRNLVRLGVVGQSLRSIDFLSQCKKMHSLSFLLGGTRNFEALSQFPNLRDFSIQRTQKLEGSDLMVLNDVATIRKLSIREQPRITTLDWLTNKYLETIELEGPKNVPSTSTLPVLPNLKSFILRGKVGVSQVAELIKFPKLDTLFVYEGHIDKLKAALTTRTLPFAIKPII